MQDLNDMLYFAEVAERGGFAAASRVLGLPKSRLSRRIAELEARLGVRLLQRTTRKLSLTDVGEVYFRHCAAMRDQANAANDAVAQVRTEPRGTIRVSCPVTVAHEILGPVLPEFLASFPQVRIDMKVTNRVIDLVEEGIDVALRVRQSIGDSPSLIAKHLGVDATSMVAAPALLDRLGQPSGPDDLQRLVTVSMSAVDGKASWGLKGPDGADYVFHHQPRYVVDDLPTLKYAVVQGVGVGVLPRYMCAAELASGALRLVLPGWAPPFGYFHAVFPSRRGLVPAVRHFLDFLERRIGGACPKDAAGDWTLDAHAQARSTRPPPQPMPVASVT